MSVTAIDSVQALLNSIVQVGGKICLIASLDGLMISVASALDDKEREEALSAISSVVIPAGETAGHELSGSLKDILIRTDQEIIIAKVLDSDPKTAVMVIADKSFERLMVETLQEKYALLSKALDGAQVDVRTGTLGLDHKDTVSKFFDALIKRISSSTNIKELLSIMIEASDDYAAAIGQWSTTAYEINAFNRRLRNIIKSSPDLSLEEMQGMTLKEINNWRKKSDDKPVTAGKSSE